MLDRDRILAKLDELDGYLSELQQVLPESYARFMESAEKRRACERLLQISIKCVDGGVQEHLGTRVRAHRQRHCIRHGHQAASGF